MSIILQPLNFFHAMIELKPFFTFYRKAKQLCIKLAGNVTTPLSKNYSITPNCAGKQNVKDLFGVPIAKANALCITAEKSRKPHFIFPKRMP